MSGPVGERIRPAVRQADIMRDVKLCSGCTFHWQVERDGEGRAKTHHPCGMFRDGTRLRDARTRCQGTMWRSRDPG